MWIPRYEMVYEDVTFVGDVHGLAIFVGGSA